MAALLTAYRENENSGLGSGFQRQTTPTVKAKPKVNYTFKPPAWMTPQAQAEVAELIRLVGLQNEHEGTDSLALTPASDLTKIAAPDGSEQLGIHAGMPFSDRIRVGDTVAAKGPTNWRRALDYLTGSDEWGRPMVRPNSQGWNDTGTTANDWEDYRAMISGIAIAAPMPPEWVLQPRNLWADLELLSWFTPGGLAKNALQRLGRALIGEIASDLRKELVKRKAAEQTASNVRSSAVPAFAGWFNFGECAIAATGGVLYWGIPSIIPGPIYSACDSVGSFTIAEGVQPTSWSPSDHAILSIYKTGIDEASIRTTWFKAGALAFNPASTWTGYGDAVIPRSITNKSYGDAIPNAQATTWPSPPRAGTKEVKIRVKYRAVWTAINQMTEVFDFVEALWKALPRKYQTKVKGDKLRNPQFAPKFRAGQNPKPTPQQMYDDLYRNFDKIDWPEAITQLIVNEIYDRIFGAAGKLGGSAGKKSGKGHSLQITRMGG